MKLVKTNCSKENLTLIVQLAHTHRLNTEQKNAVALQKFLSSGAKKKQIMPVRRKSGFNKEARFGHEKPRRDTGLDEKNLAAKF